MSKFTGMFAALKGRGLAKAKKDEQTDDLQGFPTHLGDHNQRTPRPAPTTGDADYDEVERLYRDEPKY